MTNSKSAKRVAQENLRLDPMFYKRKASIGGSVTGIKKGFSAMSPERVKEIQAKALATRKRNQKEEV